MSHSSAQSEDYLKSDIMVDSLIAFNGINDHLWDNDVPHWLSTGISNTIEFPLWQVLDLLSIITMMVFSESTVFLLFCLKWTQKQKSPLIFRSLISVVSADQQSSVFQMLNKQLLSSICFWPHTQRHYGWAASAMKQSENIFFFQRALGDGANGNTF